MMSSRTATFPPRGARHDHVLRAHQAGARTRLRRRMGPFFLGFLAALFTIIVSQNQPSTSRDRPFSILRQQNLALSVSVLSILLLIMILMMICVYKPIRRR